jgi:hypothetical protein
MMEIVIPYFVFDVMPLFFVWFLLGFFFLVIDDPLHGFVWFDLVIGFGASGIATLMLFVFFSLIAPTLLGIQFFNFSIGGAP